MQNNANSDIFWYGDMPFYMVEQKKSIFAKLYIGYKIYGKSEAMISIHSFAYSYRQFKKCFVENYDIS